MDSQNVSPPVHESESSDVIDFLKRSLPSFLEEVRRNNRSRSVVAGTTNADDNDLLVQAGTTDHALEGDRMDVVDTVLEETSSIPVSSAAHRYTRSMLKCFVGYPLYEPQPFSELSTTYLHQGVNVGDIGILREDGVFEFLFNICPSKNGSINPPDFPVWFSFETSDGVATRTTSPLPPEAHFFQSPVIRNKFGEYICEGPEGAILDLPEGVIQEEAMDIRPFATLAARRAAQWYEYIMNRGKEISNGSLYLITSFTKCAQWGIAVFDRPCAPGEYLRFEKKRTSLVGKSATKYYWKGTRVFTNKVSNLNQGDTTNQCVFLRGYKIMIRQDIFDNLRHDQRRRSIPETPSSSLCPLVHPSDLINAALLNQNLDARVAITHDDAWCDLLRDSFPKLDWAQSIKAIRPYTITIDEFGCISLEKTRATYSHNERRRPLQGTKISSLQGPLATVPVEIFLPLPCELVERVLLLLDANSILTCKLVNKQLNKIIQTSTLLQYFLACNAAGVIDNPKSPLSYPERLKELEQVNDLWQKLKPLFETTIKVNHQSSFFSRLSGGAYFISENALTDMHYCHLPSSPQDNVQWNKIPVHVPREGWPGTIVGFTVALYEHDLIVNCISSDTANQVLSERYSIDLVLLKFSTGEYHPLARRPRISIQRSSSARVFVGPGIAGDNLACVIHSEDGTFTDKLFIFDWKTGHKRLQHESTENSYTSLVFISPEILLVPNLILSHFEIWHIPSHPKSNPDPPVQILSLQIPAVSHTYNLFYLICRGEPNPFLHSIPYFQNRPFFASPESSIIITNLIISSNLFGLNASYTLIMHRRALLDTIQKLTSPSSLEQHEELPMWLANEISVSKTADLDDGHAALDVQSKLASMEPHLRLSPRTPDFSTFTTSLTSSASHIRPDSSSSSSSESSTTSSDPQYNFPQVSWPDWGPSISRWLSVGETQARWTMNSTGQRYAFLGSNPHNGKGMMSVADFNQHNFRRNVGSMTRVGGECEDEDGSSNDEERKAEELEMLHHGGVFVEEIYMGLKCAIYHAPDEYDFDVVLMDEERLLGLKLDHEDKVESVKVLYFG